MSSTVAVAGVMNSQLRDDRWAAWSSAPGTLRDANRGRHVDAREAAYLAELRCPEEHTAPAYPSRPTTASASPVEPKEDTGSAPAGGGGLTDCPRRRDRDRRHAAQRLAAIGGGTTGATRCPSQALRLQVVAARASRSPSPRPRRRLARPAAPQPPPPAPLSLTAYQQNVRPPRPGGQAPTFGVTGLAARPGRPRAAPRRPRLRPWPPCHGSRAVRPRLAQPAQRGPASGMSLK